MIYVISAQTCALEKKWFGCFIAINWNSDWKWTNQNFLVESIIILVETRILIDMIRMNLLIHFQQKTFSLRKEKDSFLIVFYCIFQKN